MAQEQNSVRDPQRGGQSPKGEGRFADRKSMTGLLFAVLLVIFGIWGTVNQFRGPKVDDSWKRDVAVLVDSINRIFSDPAVRDSVSVEGAAASGSILSAGEGDVR